MSTEDETKRPKADEGPPIFKRTERPKDPAACWEFRGAIDSKGYGRVFWKGRNGALAHRVAPEMHQVRAPGAGDSPGEHPKSSREENPLPGWPSVDRGEHLPVQESADLSRVCEGSFFRRYSRKQREKHDRE
jgi:hypothetical protein